MEILCVSKPDRQSENVGFAYKTQRLKGSKVKTFRMLFFEPSIRRGGFEAGISELFSYKLGFCERAKK
ncbi:MAG: hypothetical protein KDD00_12570 [Ignavibacteriae bacterium]|nr:hypothetical protein [Ignavibacteriota bacterium]